MRKKIKLGKTKDSRTRGKARAVEVEASEKLKQQLAAQPDFTHYLLTKDFSSNTIQAVIRDTDHFLTWAEKENIEVEHTSYNDVLHYIQSKRNKVKQITISKQLNSVRHYFDYLTLKGETASNPAGHIKIRGVKRKTLYNILSKQELESLYHHFTIPEATASNMNHNWFKTSLLVHKRNKVLIGLMVYQGLTVHELATLKESDIKLREGKIFIAGGRRSEERLLSLEPHQILDMMDYQLTTRKELQALSDKPIDRFFVSIGEGIYFANIMQPLMKKLREQNSKVTSAKQIRASVITHWLKLYNLRQVQYMAGHRFVSTTESYQINNLDDLQEEISKYHPI